MKQLNINENSLLPFNNSDIIEKITSSGNFQETGPDEILFIEGDNGTSIYILQSGSVKIFKSAPDGREIILRTIVPGEMFAEVILFESSRYPASAASTEISVLFTITRKRFLELLDDAPFRDSFISALMRKQRHLTERLHYLTAYEVEERFFRFLASKYGRKNIYSIDMSKKDIASSIGTIPETMSRLIRRLTDSNRIKWEGNLLSISPDFWDGFDMEE